MVEQSVRPSTAGTAGTRPVSAATAPGAGVAPAGSVPRMAELRLPPVAPPTNHGRTSAAWATTYIVLLGTTIAALAMIFAVVWAFWVGLGVVVAGVVVGKVMQVLGHGQGGARTEAAAAHHPH
ncbi:MAG TPA: HGxxPAAW family protein [Cellulomonas sp.]